MNHKASRISINCAPLPCSFSPSLCLPLLYDGVRVRAFLYMYTSPHAHAPPHSGSRVTGELEETSARSSIEVSSSSLLRSGCVSLFASYKKANGRTFVNASKTHSTENTREKREKKKNSNVSHVPISRKREGATFARYRHLINLESAIFVCPLSLLYFRLPPLLSLPVRCEMKLSHARNS